MEGLNFERASVSVGDGEPDLTLHFEAYCCNDHCTVWCGDVWAELPEEGTLEGEDGDPGGAENGFVVFRMQLRNLQMNVRDGKLYCWKCCETLDPEFLKAKNGMPIVERALKFEGGRVEQRYEDGHYLIDVIYDDGRVRNLFTGTEEHAADLYMNGLEVGFCIGTGAPYGMDYVKAQRQKASAGNGGPDGC